VPSERGKESAHVVHHPLDTGTASLTQIYRAAARILRELNRSGAQCCYDRSSFHSSVQQLLAQLKRFC
jgi:hypothetical protein